MAATKRRRRRNRISNRTHARRRNRTRNRNPHRRRRVNRARGANPRVVVRYRNRRHNRRNAGRRRNPNGNWLSGDAGAVIGLLGGAAVTNMVRGFLPANLSTGWPGYISTGIAAVLVGQVSGRMLKNPRIGNWVTIGGLLIVGLQIVNEYFPQLNLPFTLAAPTATGTSGMGLITSSNFFVPQVNLPGSMASFVTPAGIPAPVVVPATAMKGLGVATSTMNQGLRRIGRLR